MLRSNEDSSTSTTKHCNIQHLPFNSYKGVTVMLHYIEYSGGKTMYTTC